MKLKLTLIAVVAIFGALIVKAAPGDLDPTFGNGGIVITRGSYILHINAAYDAAIQSDGKIVVVGDGSNTISGKIDYDFAVVRYNTDGSLDTSFGGTGIIITPISNYYSDAAHSVAIQADGKIVVAGHSDTKGFAVVRYNTDGSLDTSFNGTGIVTTLLRRSSVACSVAIQADGKIVAAGYSQKGGIDDFALVRYDEDGTLDTTFNGTGKVITPLGDSYNRAYSVSIQADGKIVAAGNSPNGAFHAFALVRYNADGQLDTSFNGTGIVITSVSNSDSGVNGLAIQTDGKIVAVGGNQFYPNYGPFAVVRYNPNGSLDTSFGGTGKVIIPIGNHADAAKSVAIQPDGKIVAAGLSRRGQELSDFAVVRLRPNGLLDTTFNGTGIVLTGLGGYDYAGAVAIQADGKIVVAGGDDYVEYDFYDFVVVRYQGGPNADIRPRFDFDGDRQSDISVFRPSDRVWYLDQSTAGFSATQFGIASDKITPADFDGDGKSDISVYRDGTWYWLDSSTNSFGAFVFGLATDIPHPADFTGDGRDELSVYRNGTWWMFDLTNGEASAVQFGLASDKPVPADYDGDGVIDQAVYRGNGEWYLNRSAQGFAAVYFGLATDKPVPADYDGDGQTDIAVFRPSDGNWYIRRSSDDAVSATNWGLATDIPVPGDYDGDGHADIAVYREGFWYILQSSNGSINAQHFGLSSDIPVASANIQ